MFIIEGTKNSVVCLTNAGQKRNWLLAGNEETSGGDQEESY